MKKKEEDESIKEEKIKGAKDHAKEQLKAADDSAKGSYMLINTTYHTIVDSANVKEKDAQ